jgi:hypothetical protein
LPLINDRVFGPKAGGGLCIAAETLKKNPALRAAFAPIRLHD